MPDTIHSRLLALTSPFAAELVRLARAEGHAAGLATGLERGRREAQTEIDGLTYAKGQEDERARVVALFAQRVPIEGEFISAPDMLAAIRSGEPAPEAT